MDTHNRKKLGQLEQADHPDDLDSLELEQEETVHNDKLFTFWRKGDSIAEKLSETDIESKYCHEVYHHPQSGGQSPGDFYLYDDISIVSSSKTSIEGTILANDVTESRPRRKHGSASRSLNTDSSPNVPKHLQSLSNFFTNEETQMMLPPDSVLSIEGNFFVVLPHSGDPGCTLFHSLGQAVFGTERQHIHLREKVVDFICSQKGWDLLGSHVVSFYENMIDEFQCTYAEGERSQFLKRVYRHYFIDEEMEGSLIELVAASMLFHFRYTCMFLQDSDTDKTPCRVFHSFEEPDSPHLVDSRTSQKSTSKGQRTREMVYFLRVGQTHRDWRWSLVVPYLHHCKEQPCLSKSLPRGFYQANLWNVYGLNWEYGETFSVNRRIQNRFHWKNGTVVVPTSSGKLLGGYFSHGRNLFSNLCGLLPNCVHLNGRCLLQETVQFCPSKLSLSSFSNPLSLAEAIVRNKERSVKRRAVTSTSSLVTPVGTLKDLRKAGKIFNFGYYVVGVDEYGEFQTLARHDRDTILYLIAKTREDIVTEWCALGDMRTLKTSNFPSDHSLKKCWKPRSQSSSSTLLNNNSCSSNVGNTSHSDSTKPFLSAKKTKHRRRLFKFVPFRISISKYLRRLRLFLVCWLHGSKNKVHHQKFFPFSDLYNSVHDSASSSSSV